MTLARFCTTFAHCRLGRTIALARRGPGNALLASRGLGDVIQFAFKFKVHIEQARIFGSLFTCFLSRLFDFAFQSLDFFVFLNLVRKTRFQNVCDFADLDVGGSGGCVNGCRGCFNFSNDFFDVFHGSYDTGHLLCGTLSQHNLHLVDSGLALFVIFT